MFAIDHVILVSALLLLIAIVARKLALRLGVPMLVVFVAIGILAGSEGFGGIEFEDYELAHGVGTAALALILFDGGLRTPRSSIAAGWRPALVLSTAGVVITAVVTGAAATWLLGITPLEGLLLGSVVASTDAAAVFASLRSQGAALPPRLNTTLEIESGSNDPMAIFMTTAVIGVLTGHSDPGIDLLALFAMQIGVGIAAGLLCGRLGAVLINRIRLDAAGLYPLLAAGLGLLSYGGAAAAGGSGFLAVYLTGIVLGNTRLVFRRGILLFQDTLAWFGQVAMFVLLGLLCFPSRLLAVAWEGMAIALVLALVARPAAVWLGLLPFSFSRRERLLISWVGLRGAVPIILATYPLMSGLDEIGHLVFDVVFFAVLLSALVQGWSMSAVARRLRLTSPAPVRLPVSLDIATLREVDSEIVDYEVAAGSRAAHTTIADLGLPDQAVAALIVRGDDIVLPRGSIRLLPGDRVFVVLRPQARDAVDDCFGVLPPEPVG